MKKICELGIVHKIFREYNTSIYFMHDFFRDIKIKKALEGFIPNIRRLAFDVKKLFSIATTPLIRNIIKPLNKMLHYCSPFFRDKKAEEYTHIPQLRGFRGINSVLAGLNIIVKSKQ